MPAEATCKGIRSLKFLSHQVIIKEISQQLELENFKAIATKPDIPEYGRYKTRYVRKMEKLKDTKIKQLAFYTPLIDLTPSDPSTMMTPMVEAGKTTHSTGQKDTVFTCDQQLYKVLTDKNWAYPERFQYLIP